MRVKRKGKVICTVCVSKAAKCEPGKVRSMLPYTPPEYERPHIPQSIMEAYAEAHEAAE